MCGRYARAKDKAALIEEFDVTVAPAEDLPADYNVAPTKRVYAVADRVPQDSAGEPQRELLVATWGLVPSWAKDPKIGSRMINARAETAASKPAFRAAFSKRRCLIPADGFYEWYTSTDPDAPRGTSGKPLKQPFYIHLPDGESLAMAGLYEFWRDRQAGEDAPWLLTVTILTTTATDAIGRIHDRMPFHIPPEHRAEWLDPAVGATGAAAVLDPTSADRLVSYPVATTVNSVRNNGPELIEPLPAE